VPSSAWRRFCKTKLSGLKSRTRPAGSTIFSPVIRLAFGESRFDSVRVGYELPLGVQYEVLGDVRTVVVYDVWRIDAKMK
jgi:hypothetical protein